MRATSVAHLWGRLIGLGAIGLLCAAALASCTPQQVEAGLANLAPDRLAVGGAISGYGGDLTTGDYLDVADHEFDAITSTAYMGWNGFEPDGGPNDPVDTSGFEAVVDWARPDKRVHGHVLVYPLSNQALPWYQNPATDHETVLKKYVDEMAGARKGDVWVWDVVNEVIADPGDSRRDEFGLRTDYIEYQSIGSDYVDKAFRWAKAADPDALLILNEYGAEEPGPKADDVFNYVTELRDRGVPIDGVGFQMHIGAFGEPDYQGMRDNFQRFADAGFKLFITEMDVGATESATEADTPTLYELQRQSRIFGEITRLALDQPAVESLLMWDYTDGRSWLHPTRVPLGNTPIGTYTFPTPFSGGEGTDPIAKKLAYLGIVGALVGDPRPEPPTAAYYRLSSGWEQASSYLLRDGDPDGSGGWVAQSAVQLGTLDAESETWTSMHWSFEDAGDGLFHIRNRWEGGSGYLTRLGEPDGSGGYTPADSVYVDELSPDDWPSQKWRLESTGFDTYRISSAWDPGSGYLTRLGEPDGTGGHTPTDQVHLTSFDPTFESQTWQRVPVAGT